MAQVDVDSGSVTPKIVVSNAVPTEDAKAEAVEQKPEDLSEPSAVNDESESKDEDAAEVKAEAVKVGMECDLKHLYQKEDDKGRTTWSDKYPEDLEEAAENEKTARFAILVRNKKSFDSRKKLEIDSIVIQSPLLKNVLAIVLKDYPGKSQI